MWPFWLKATLGLGAAGAALFFIKPAAAANPATLPPVIVPQGVADPTTGKTIVTMADEVQAFNNVQAASTFPDAAKALYTYIKANGYDESAALANLVEQFQTAANSVVIGTAFKYGQLDVNGVFDIVTASTLGQQIGDPLPADPAAPRPPNVAFGDPVNVNAASLALDAAWLLMKYIQINGVNASDPNQVVLTRQYQVAYNTDPKNPGPGWALTATPPTTTKLAEDGILGPATSAQLYKNQSQSDFNATGDTLQNLTGVAPTDPAITGAAQA